MPVQCRIVSEKCSQGMSYDMMPSFLLFGAPRAGMFLNFCYLNWRLLVLGIEEKLWVPNDQETFPADVYFYYNGVISVHREKQPFTATADNHLI